MTAAIAITLMSLLVFALYLWLVLTFGLRTRRTTFRSSPRRRASRRQKRTLWVVGGKDENRR